MTPVLLLGLLLSGFVVLSYGYFLANDGNPDQSNLIGPLFATGSFIESFWFHDGNKI